MGCVAMGRQCTWRMRANVGDYTKRKVQFETYDLFFTQSSTSQIQEVSKTFFHHYKIGRAHV